MATLLLSTNTSRHTHRRPTPRPASRRPSKFAKAPSAAVLTLLATLAAARPLDDVALQHPVDVPDFLCPAFTSATTVTHSFSPSPALRSGTARATIPVAHYQYSATVETASASAPTPQQDLGHRTFYATRAGYNYWDENASASVETQADSATTALASRQALSSKSVSNFRTPVWRAKRKFRRNDEDRDSDSDSDADEDDSTLFELYTSRTIPDRYELGSDGRWHKLSFWSSCSLCQSHDVDDSSDDDITTTGVTDDTDHDDDDALAATYSSTTNASSSTTSVIAPDGWGEHKTNSKVYQVPLIVVASLLLVAIISGAVWLAFFWRRRRRRAKKAAEERDVEKRKKLDGRESEDEESECEDGNGEAGAGWNGRRRRGEDVYGDHGRREKSGEEKAKARWARATAQWKAHARWIHRRRRGKVGIVEGMMQRDDARASGVSLARSVASSARIQAEGTDTSPSVSAGRLRLDSRDSEPAHEPVPELGPGSGSGSGGADGEGQGQESQMRTQEEGSSSGVHRYSHERSRIMRLDIPHVLLPYSRPPGEGEAYDQPPALSPVEMEDGDEEGGEVQGPPAYRSRGGVRGNARERGRDEKQAAVPGYVPAPEDCAPYASSDEDEVEDDEEDTRRRSSVGGLDVGTNMHVAVDDKRALARLAEYASAPPPPEPSSPAPSFPSSPTHLHTAVDLANVPGLDDFALDMDSLDSPGAGPGPSTAVGKLPSLSPSLPPLALALASPFPAPPVPISSKLAYAPADAGLVEPSFGSDDGFDLECEPSAPPFFDEPLGENGCDFAGASAPPLFEDEFGDDGDVDSVGGAPSNNECIDEPELDASESLPSDVHPETTDRNAVPTAVK